MGALTPQSISGHPVQAVSSHAASAASGHAGPVAPPVSRAGAGASSTALARQTFPTTPLADRPRLTIESAFEQLTEAVARIEGRFRDEYGAAPDLRDLNDCCRLIRFADPVQESARIAAETLTRGVSKYDVGLALVRSQLERSGHFDALAPERRADVHDALLGRVYYNAPERELQRQFELTDGLIAAGLSPAIDRGFPGFMREFLDVVGNLSARRRLDGTGDKVKLEAIYRHFRDSFANLANMLSLQGLRPASFAEVRALHAASLATYRRYSDGDTSTELVQ